MNSRDKSYNSCSGRKRKKDEDYVAESPEESAERDRTPGFAGEGGRGKALELEKGN